MNECLRPFDLKALCHYLTSLAIDIYSPPNEMNRNGQNAFKSMISHQGMSGEPIKVWLFCC